MQMNTIARRSALAGTAAACLMAGAMVRPLQEDAAILEAFDRWVEQMRALDAMAADAEDNAFSDACDVADEIVSEIAGMPAEGMVGVAVKAFLLAHDRCGGTRDNSLRIGAPMKSDDSRGGGLHRSMLADVRPWLPAACSI